MFNEIVEACKQFHVDEIPPTTFTGTGYYELSIGYALIRYTKAKNIVELGTNKGWSSKYWGLAAKEIGRRVTTYEQDEEYATFARSYLSTVPVDVVLGDLKQTFNKEPIDFLFVDAEHSRDMAEWYIENVFPLVHGWIGVHDIDIGDSIVGKADKGLFGEIEVINDRYSKEYIKTRDVSEKVWGTRGILHVEPDGNNSAIWMKK